MLDWDNYFLFFARIASMRSTCVRRKVGAILVRDKHILSTGYNGPPKDFMHCNVLGCKREQENIPSGQQHEFCRGVHAEQNSIIQAAYHGLAIKDSVLYCTHHPCVTCLKMLINAGINTIYYEHNYSDKLSTNIIGESQLKLIQINYIDSKIKELLDAN